MIKYYILREISRTDKSIDTKSRFMVVRGWERVTADGYSTSFGEDENVLELDRAPHCEYIKCY